MINITIIKKLLCLIFIFLFPLSVSANSDTNRNQAFDLLHKYITEYNLSLSDIKAVVDTMHCETAGTWDPNIQSADRRPDGSQEQSFGLAQIYLPMHPEITKDQATDPDFAVRFMVKNFKAGHQHLWSCYDFVTSTSTNKTNLNNLDIEPSVLYTEYEKYCLARFKTSGVDNSA